MTKPDFDLYACRNNIWYECTVVDAFKIKFKKTRKKIRYDYYTRPYKTEENRRIHV